MITTMNIVTILCIFFRDLLMSSTYIFLGVKIFNAKFKKSIPLIMLFILSFAGTALLGELYFYPAEKTYDTMAMLSVLLYIVSIICLLENVKKKKLIFFVLIFNSIIDMLDALVGKYLPEEYYIECISYMVIYAVIIAVTIKYAKTNQINVLPEVMATIPNWFLWILVIFCFSEFYSEVGEIPKLVTFFEIISPIGIVLCIVYFIYKIFHLTYQQNEILKQMHEQKEFSEKMLTSDENLRKFRHDYRNHMIVINALMESGRTDRAREYLNAMNSDIDSTINKISTGNFISDAIINNKVIVAAKDNAKIRFSGQIPENGIADDDLCTIIANIVDNAIEAVNNLEGDKTVCIEAAVRNGMFLLNISNPVVADVKIRKDGTVKTTKKNHHEHGIGMKNVQKVVKKYGGSVNVTCENKVFNISIMLKPLM